MQFSISRKICFFTTANITFCTLVIYTFSMWGVNAPIQLPLILLITLPFSWWGCARIARHITARLHALESGLKNFKDKDFSISIYNKYQDELGSVISLYNEVGSYLRDERQTIYQRELLLDTVIQNANISLFLTDSRDKVIYANIEARQLIGEGKPIQGTLLSKFLKNTPEQLQTILAKGEDGLFSINRFGENQTYHLSHNQFTLNNQKHQLYLIKHLTSALHQQEIRTWKKIIRLVSHEINNSLAPISSMAHSGKQSIEKNRLDKLDLVFDTIIDRLHIPAQVEHPFR